jgi:hypothetical protein
MGGGCSGTMNGNVVERFFRRDYDEQEDDCKLTRHFHQEVEVRDTPLDECHPGVVEEVLDVHPAWRGREVVDDDDVVVLR